MSRHKRWRLVDVIERTQLTSEERRAAFGTGATEDVADSNAEDVRNA